MACRGTAFYFLATLSVAILGSKVSTVFIYEYITIICSINLEIQNVYKSPDIVTEIKVRRLEWLGHVVRMEDTRLPKMVFNSKPEGRRGVGRPRLRWLDDVEADIKALGVKRWRIRAQDRKEWSAILMEAKAKLKGREARE
jgi:hypothetical protein